MGRGVVLDSDPFVRAEAAHVTNRERAHGAVLPEDTCSDGVHVGFRLDRFRGVVLVTVLLNLTSV